MTREYMLQNEAFLQRIRDKMNTIQNSEAFIQYTIQSMIRKFVEGKVYR